MKLTVFKAGDGDSCLLQGHQANILIDGGRQGPFEEYVLPVLEQLHDEGGELDLVCVSHIDDDHITGIAELIERRRAWAIHHAQTTIPDPDDPESEAPNPDHRAPRFADVPVIHHLWHNGFGETFEAAANPVTNALGFHSQLLSASQTLRDSAFGETISRIAQGAKLAIKLQLMLGSSPMGIELNAPSDGARLTSTPLTVADFSGTRLLLLSPAESTFKKLQAEWDKWVKKNQEVIDRMKDQFQASVATGAANALDFLAFAANLTQSGGAGNITPPNLASICFLAEEDGQTILMTGDDSSEHILAGLEAHDLLDPDTGGLHVNILKVSHHGADANTTSEFARRITADHYVFCGNGRHDNPEKSVIDRYVASRVSNDEEIKSANAQVDDDFTLWFNYSDKDAEVKSNSKFKKTIRLAKKTVKAHQRKHRQIDFLFNDDGHFTIDLD